MGPVVSVVHTEDLTEDGIRKATFNAIDSSGFEMPRKVGSVFLKVNLRYYWDSSTGETTDPRVVSAIIDYIRERSCSELDIAIAEADASAMRTKYAFKMLGYEKLAERKNVRLVNLSQCETVEKEAVVNDRKMVLPIAQPMLEADVLVNVPKLRTHRLVTISCGLKNLFGAIAKPRKITYHAHLNEVIVGINKLLKPDLTVIDGFIALGEWPIKMGLVLASTDVLAADYVAAKIMGYDPTRIAHLGLARKEGAGTFKDVKIQAVKDLASFSKVFPRVNHYSSNLLWDLKLAALNVYLKVTKDTKPPVLDK